MRRTPRASASRLFGRACAVPVTIGVLLASAFSASNGIAAAEPSSPDGHRVACRRDRERQPEAAGPGCRRAGPAGGRQQGDRRCRNRARQRRRGTARRGRQPSGRRRLQRRDQVRATAVRHLRGVDVRQRTVEFVSDRRRPLRHPRHRRGGPDAGRQRTAGRRQTCSGLAPSRSTRSRRRGWPSRRPTRPPSTRRPARTPRCRR